MITLKDISTQFDPVVARPLFNLHLDLRSKDS